MVFDYHAHYCVDASCRRLRILCVLCAQRSVTFFLGRHVDDLVVLPISATIRHLSPLMSFFSAASATDAFPTPSHNCLFLQQLPNKSVDLHDRQPTRYASPLYSQLVSNGLRPWRINNRLVTSNTIYGRVCFLCGFLVTDISATVAPIGVKF